MQLDNNKDKILTKLRGSNYEIADGEPDILGWDVENRTAQKIGSVVNLLFDEESRKVRYIVVSLADNDFEVDEGKKVLVPIGVAELYGTEEKENIETAEELDEVEDEYVDEINTDHDSDKEEEMVLVPVDAEQLNELPDYKKLGITPEIERYTRKIFAGTLASGAEPVIEGKDFYDHDHFDENRFYGRQSKGIKRSPGIEYDIDMTNHIMQAKGDSTTTQHH